MQNKLKRIILDLEDLSEEPYIDRESRDSIIQIIRELEAINIYSTEVR